MMMSTVKECVQQLEEAGVLEPGRVAKLAAASLKLEFGGRAVSAKDAIKELFGVKKPLGERMMSYVSEGFQQAKPRVGFALAGVAAASVAGLAVKAINEIKFRSALEGMKKDPEVQADHARAVSIAKMVRRWAPSIAADSEVLRGTVKNLMKFPDSYLTYDIASKLSDAEKRYAATHGLFALLQQRVF
jgi:hypothetical protein